ncbi:MAG: autotransporter assembly complex family protein [Pseudomonadota bacterium]
MIFSPPFSAFSCLRERLLAGLVILLISAPLLALEVQVEVLGVSGELEENIRAHLAILQVADPARLTAGRLRRLHARAEAQIRAALEPFGYYQAEVDARLSQEQGRKGHWRARYEIRPGAPARVVRVNYVLSGEGAQDDVFPADFGLAEGEVLDHRRYEAARDALLLAAAERGYLDAVYRVNRVTVDPIGNTAEVHIEFDTGPRYFFGPVDFDQTLLDEDIMRRFVRFDAGDPYDQNRLLRLQTSLLDAQYFQRVSVEPQTEKTDPDTNQVPLTVHAEPAKPNKFRVGLGFATDTGPRVTFDWQRRYFGRRGHRGEVTLQLSPVLQQLSGEYRIPLERVTTEYVLINPELYRYKTDTRFVQSAHVDVHQSVVRDGWRRNLGIEYRYEDYDLGEEEEDVDELVPYVTYSKTATDSLIYATRGYRLKLSLLGAIDGLVSPASYAQLSVSGKWVRSVAEDYRFIARADLGATLADSVNDLPASRRFFAGGDHSMRGYQLDDLGPRDPDSGDILGGRFLGVGSLELERRLRGKWSAAVFYDFGNAYDPDLDNEFAQSVGAGVRWLSPVGQVRVDVGVGIDDEDTPVRLHVIIGPDL